MPIKKGQNLMGKIARRIDVPTGEDKFFGKDDQQLILDLAGKVRQRARSRGKPAGRAGAPGVVLLLTGSEGTGKTLAAKLLSKALDVPLYRVDLAGLVNKYIGETEKNLNKLFEEAQTSNAILFFDEADALFGQRTDVKDSHDRFGNLETGYLLQRLESHPGVIVLASNMRQNISEPFVRLVDFTVDFAGSGGKTKVRVLADDSAGTDRVRRRGK